MEAQVLGAETEVPKYRDIEAVYVEAVDNRDTVELWREAIEKSMSSKCILRVMKTFHDKHTNKEHRLGELFIVPTERAAELLANKMKLVERI